MRIPTLPLVVLLCSSYRCLELSRKAGSLHLNVSKGGLCLEQVNQLVRNHVGQLRVTWQQW